MTDIITYDYDYFKSFDNKICENPEINKKVMFILKSYKCFSNNKEYKNFLIKKTKFKNENVNKPLNILLNKITNDNYIKLRDNILDLVEFIDIEHIISCILTYSELQIVYSNIFVNLLVAINHKKNIIYYLNHEIHSFINSKWYYISSYDNIDDDSDEDSYDTFCKNIANKNKIINRFKTLINIVYLFNLDYNIHNLCNYSLKLFKLIIKKDKNIENIEKAKLRENIEKRDVKYELYFEFIIYLFDKNKRFNKRNKKELLYMHNQILELFNKKLITAKIKFKSLDLIE